ncbi:MAG TPA: PH domain-containing protein [Sporichthyaceae bacterium]
MSRPLGLGPLRTTTLPEQQAVVVRQPAALGVGVFLLLVSVAFAAAVLADPGQTVNSGSGFLDRWFFGVLVVPMLWGTDRFLLRPRVRVDDTGVAFHNPLQTIHTPWPGVAGAAFDRHLTLALADHDQVRSILFGPALSGPMTREHRVKELVALINTESARRAGGQWDPDELYAAEPLIGTQTDRPAPAGPGSVTSPAYGIAAAIGYAAVWTVACVLAAS